MDARSCRPSPSPIDSVAGSTTPTGSRQRSRPSPRAGQAPSAIGTIAGAPATAPSRASAGSGDRPSLARRASSDMRTMRSRPPSCCPASFGRRRRAHRPPSRARRGRDDGDGHGVADRAGAGDGRGAARRRGVREHSAEFGGTRGRGGSIARVFQRLRQVCRTRPGPRRRTTRGAPRLSACLARRARASRAPRRARAAGAGTSAAAAGSARPAPPRPR